MKVVTFGEIMLRLSPPGAERLLQSPTLSATFGGAEANVAVSLAHWGFESVYVSRVPPHALGDAAIRALRAEGVQTAAIVRGGTRLGIYFAENGAGQRASTVVYDRTHSAISEIEPGAINWGQVLDGAAWFHVSGVTAALGAGPAHAVVAALAVARGAGIRTSLDLNYRRKLWSESQAQATLRPVMKNVNVVFANEEDLQTSLGFHVSGIDVRTGRVDPAAYRDVISRVCELGPELVAITLRESISASDNGWTAVLGGTQLNEVLQGPRHDVRVVDRIGAGDAFAAGMIYALLTGREPLDALRFAVAAGALKHTVPGDFNRVSVEEVDRLAAGDGSGRVQR